MARVPTHRIDDAPQASREPLERQSERVGKTINIFGAMAHSPALIGAYDAVETVLAERTSLDPAVRPALHLTVANVNQCGYCQAAYTGAAKGAGYTEEQTFEIRRGKLAGDDRLTALLTFAREIAERQGYVADGTWQDTLDAGWDEQQLLDAFAEVIRTTLTNWFNHLNGTELDLPEAPALD